MAKRESLMRINEVEPRILLIRDKKVMLDFDLAELYGVETKELTQAVKRNSNRFPADFMFRVTRQEVANLRSQIVTSSSWGGRRTLPYAFTEQGVAMLSSVLRSKRAVKVNIEIMRAFVRLRAMLATHADLARNLRELEDRVTGHDEAIKSLVIAIRNLIEGPRRSSKGKIGFLPGGK